VWLRPLRQEQQQEQKQRSIFKKRDEVVSGCYEAQLKMQLSNSLQQ
jgi:hypothetical protein